MIDVAKIVVLGEQIKLSNSLGRKHLVLWVWSFGSSQPKDTSAGYRFFFFSPTALNFADSWVQHASKAPAFHFYVIDFSAVNFVSSPFTKHITLHVEIHLVVKVIIADYR